MVSHLDVLMYLIAIKSLYLYLREGQIVILNDGTLTSHDIELLRYHLSPSQIVTINDIKSRKCPQGGCWERLLFILDCVKDNYVIQLDSDTLTLNDIPEVVNSIMENRSFTLGTWKRQEVQSIKETCQNVRSSNSNHIQIIAEKNFDKLPGCDQLKYVRGCAAFTGFARQSFSRSKAEEFSQQMEAIIGQRWSDWGSEQVTSNFIIANSIPSMVLPYPKYAGFMPDRNLKESAFLHFSGTYRFKNGGYKKAAKNIIKSLT